MGSYIILYISTLVPVWELATCCDVTEGTDWCGLVPVVREFLHMHITKTCLYNVDPLKPHFYIIKLGFPGVYIICLISAQKHEGSSNEYPQSMFWAELWKISEFLSENFHSLVVKISAYLNRLVFVMSFNIPLVQWIYHHLGHKNITHNAFITVHTLFL